jgi:hypothetical protein
MKHFSPFRFDLVNECLWRKRERGPDERVPLTPKTFAVLRYLVDHAAQLVTHDQLLDEVWPATHVQPQAVMREILNLRRALGGGRSRSATSYITDTFSVRCFIKETFSAEATTRSNSSIECTGPTATSFDRAQSRHRERDQRIDSILWDCYDWSFRQPVADSVTVACAHSSA